MPATVDTTGAPTGGSAGVASTAGDDAGPVPTELDAVTVTPYSVPLTRPGIVNVYGPAAGTFTVVAAPPRVGVAETV